MRVQALVLLVLAAAAPDASAWNTDGSMSWRSVYLGTRAASEMPPARFTGNEHTELSHLSLAALDLHVCFGIERVGGGSCTWQVIDLNASLFRRNLMGEIGHGDDESTPLEERSLPPPAHFAGLPDYSWSVYDWINKNTLCAALPPSGGLVGCDCHEFAGWMGMYNANHFGTQARLMYERYHRIALALAERARLLRVALEAAPRPANAAAHDVYVREAEFEALVFEAVGQHFFQDRWSMGHMWERWNGGDPNTAASPADSAQAAIASGLMHGHEGVSSVPDPLCSPVVGLTSATPVEWVSSGLGGPYPGVGDYRLEDVYDGFVFDTDLPLAVPTQRNQMIDCTSRGWAEVVRGFGATGPGVFGSWKATLAAPALPPVLDDASCWDQWATNAAISSGWTEGSLVTSLDTLLRGRLTVLLGVAPAPCEPFRSVRPGLDWGAVTAEILLQRIYDGGGTGLAHGGIPDLGGAAQGGAYASVPAYVEPERLDTLADGLDVLRGRDKRAVFGFFNRAHADHWCQGLAARLNLLRASADPIDQAACAYLADRTYKGTDVRYRGRQREVRRSGGQEVDPICSFLGPGGPALDERRHVYIDPGYVRMPNAAAAYSTESIVAWCAKVPVIEGGPCSGESPADGSDDWDVVGRVGSEGGEVALRGQNFGTTPGQVMVGPLAAGPFSDALSVVRWSDTEIAVDVPAGALADGDWFLQVRPTAAPGSWSVGRFILRVGGEPCGAVEPSLVALWRLGNDILHGSRLEVFFFSDGTVVQYDAPFFTTWTTVGTWSTVGNAISVDPCPGIPPGKASFRFRGTWSAHPVTDGFGVISCPGPQADVCPAMRGAFTRIFDDGSEVPAPVEFDTSGGYVPLAALFPLLPTQDCHGTCWQRWIVNWPHFCAEAGGTPGACGAAAASTCGGRCPDDFSCKDLDGGCSCIEDAAATCAPPAGPCPVGRVCRSNGLCVY